LKTPKKINQLELRFAKKTRAMFRLATGMILEGWDEVMS